MAVSRIQFGRHLECPICMERYSPRERIPKVLQCGHTFCNICLENLAAHQRIECPKCKVNHAIPSRGVQDISTNHDILGMLDYSCKECLRYGHTSRCSHCKKMLCSSCRGSHKGDLQKSVIDSITSIQQMSSSLGAEWSLVNNKISAIISQCDVFCMASSKDLATSTTLDYLESTQDHASHFEKMLREIQTTIQRLPSDIDVDLMRLNITAEESPDTDPVVTESVVSEQTARYQNTPILVYGRQGNRPGELWGPQGVAVDLETGDIHVADCLNHKVNMYSETGRYVKSYGFQTSDGRGLSCPCGITIDRQGHRIVTDNHAVSIYTRDGNLHSTFGKKGDGRADFKDPRDIDSDIDGLLYIADSGNSCVHVCNQAGECLRVVGNRDPGRLLKPIGVALDGDGDIYVTDFTAKRVNIYTASGQYKSSITAADVPQRDWEPRSVIVDGHRQLYVTDWMNHCVHVLKDGRHIQHIGSQGDRQGCFDYPTGIALSRDGNIVVCDYNHRVQVFGKQ